MPVQQSFSWDHGIIAYGAALETETTFVIVEDEGKYEINIMSIQDFVSIPLGKYVSNNLEFGVLKKDQSYSASTISSGILRQASS